MIKLSCCIGSLHHTVVPHFVEHYLSMGIRPEDFIVVVNSPEKNQDHTFVMKSLKRRHIFPVAEWVGPFYSPEWHQWQCDTLKNLTEEDWVLVPDSDELIEFPQPLAAFLQGVNDKGFNAVKGYETDRIAEDGSFPWMFNFPANIWQQFPVIADVTKEVLGQRVDKVCAMKGHLRTDGNLHHFHYDWWEKVSLYPRWLNAHHFKWEATVVARLKHRIKIWKDKGEIDHECRNFIEYFEQHGKIDLSNPKLNVRRSKYAGNPGVWSNING